jgi:hypothetical protein
METHARSIPLYTTRLGWVGDKPTQTYNDLKGKSNGYAEIDANGARGSERVTEAHNVRGPPAGEPLLGKSTFDGAGNSGSDRLGRIRRVHLEPLEKYNHAHDDHGALFDDRRRGRAENLRRCGSRG